VKSSYLREHERCLCALKGRFNKRTPARGHCPGQTTPAVARNPGREAATFRRMPSKFRLVQEEESDYAFCMNCANRTSGRVVVSSQSIPMVSSLVTTGPSIAIVCGIPPEALEISLIPTKQTLENVEDAAIRLLRRFF
jgi:hypothetical protein